MPLSFLPEAVPTAIGWAHPLTGEQLTAGAIPASQLDGDTPVDFYKPNAKGKSFLDPAGSTRNLINHVAHGKRVEFAVHSLDKIASVAWTFGGAAVASVNVTAGGAVQQKVFPAGTHSVKAVVSYVGGTPANVTLNTSVTVA